MRTDRRLDVSCWPSGRLAVCATLAAAPLQAQDIGLPIGTQAQAVVIPDLEGVPQDLGQFIGKKPVLIQFWATWCSLCKALLPQLEKVKQTYGDRVELIGINVTVNESKSRARRYLAEHKPPYRVLWDEKGAGTRAYETPSTSYILVLNAAGKVVYTGVGSDQDLVAAVRKAVVSP
ncbi:MAG: TlpA family protein disulfide reductase [Gemmatimonadales bacterium]